MLPILMSYSAFQIVFHPYSSLSRGFFILFFGLFIEELTMNDSTFQFAVFLVVVLLFVLFIGSPDLHDALAQLATIKAGS